MRNWSLIATALLTTSLAAQKHPDFDDGGALTWHTELAKAKQAATEQDRFLFVEYGRAA